MAHSILSSAKTLAWLCIFWMLFLWHRELQMPFRYVPSLVTSLLPSFFLPPPPPPLSPFLPLPPPLPPLLPILLCTNPFFWRLENTTQIIQSLREDARVAFYRKWFFFFFGERQVTDKQSKLIMAPGWILMTHPQERPSPGMPIPRNVPSFYG